MDKAAVNELPKGADMAGILDGKVIVVAGAGAIGSGLARRYVAEGAHVVLGDRDEDHVRSVARDIDPSGRHIVGTVLDGADDASIRAMVELATSTYGRLDGFHANYASFVDGQSPDCIELELELYDEVMRVNARGYLLCARHAVPALIQNGGGSMVFTSSAEAHQPSGTRIAYAMSKASLHALMRNVATRYGRQGIRANVIAPGLILHPRLAANLSDGFLQSARQRTAIKVRFGEPADIAGMGAFLLSDDAGYITGQVISVDGGLTMRS